MTILLLTRCNFVRQHIAASKGYEDCVLVLLKHSCNVNVQGEWSPVRNASTLSFLLLRFSIECRCEWEHAIMGFHCCKARLHLYTPVPLRIYLQSKHQWRSFLSSCKAKRYFHSEGAAEAWIKHRFKEPTRIDSLTNCNFQNASRHGKLLDHEWC